MVSPLDSSDDAALMHRHKRRVSHTRLCDNGVCTVYPRPDVPMCFSEGAKASKIVCDANGLLVSYEGPGLEERDAASIRTDCSIPMNGIGLYYFEISVINQGNTGRIGVGLCESKVKLEKMPGWENGSYAYHGDDGLLFRQSGVSGSAYGPKYGTDDVIGCCWDLIDNVVFFTKNGENLGPAFRNITGELFPTVGMQSTGGQIAANFGASSFTFDIEAYGQQQREKVLVSIMARKLPRDYRIHSDIVLSYLMHNGYSRTAAAFAKDAGREQTYQEERESMMKRQAVCQKVILGDIDGAIADIESQFPQVMDQHLNVRFLLHTQKFIDMLVKGSKPEDAVSYGLKTLWVFQNPDYIAKAEAQDSEQGGPRSSFSYNDVLSKVYSLLAYGDPTTSPEHKLTEPSRREMVADRLNSAILASQGRPMRSVLERLICQNRNVLNHLVDIDNGPAALVSEQDVL